MRNRPLCSICLIVFLLLCIGMLMGGDSFFRNLAPPELEKQEGKQIQFTGRVYQIEIRESYQILYLIHSNEQSRFIVYDDTKQSIQIGNKIKVSGELSLFEEARNPGDFDQKLYYEKQKICASLWAEDCAVIKSERKLLRQKLYELRRQWKELLLKTMGKKEGAVLGAILLGEKSEMDREIKELYQVNGIAHVLAVSGLHLSLIGAGMYQLFRRMTGSYIVGGIAGIIFLGGYILMIGTTVSALRSLIMFLFRIGADVFGRKYDSPTALAIAAVIVFFWRPLSIYDGGFWLSFGAVLAIIVILPIVNNLPFQGIWVSLSVNIMVTPILMYIFYEFPLYGILLNLVVVPMIPILIIMGFFGSLFAVFWRDGGAAVLFCCRVILRIFESGSKAVLEFPCARIITGQPELWKIIGYYILLFGIVITVRVFKNIDRRKKALLVVLMAGTAFCVLFFKGKAKEELTVTALDVGQGDGIVVRGPKGNAYLIDGGSSDVGKVGEYRMEPYLLSQGIGSLDYVFVTHGDQDHINGIAEMIGRQKNGVEIKNLVFPVQSVWDDALWELAEAGGKAGIPVLIMQAGDCLEEGKMTLTCIQPDKEEISETGNCASLVLALRYGDFDMLFTGDVEGEGEECLITHLQEEEPDRKWEILKAAHHGSKHSTTEEFLKAAPPKYAFISAGRNNTYGHPHKDTLNRLEDVGTIVYSTQEEGALTVSVSEEGFWISGFK